MLESLLRASWQGGTALLAAAMKEFEMLRGRAQAPASQVLATEAKPEELQDALRPFVRRFMLSPRLRALLEERRR